jgi:hypothetical protein
LLEIDSESTRNRLEVDDDNGRRRADRLEFPGHGVAEDVSEGFKTTYGQIFSPGTR